MSPSVPAEAPVMNLSAHLPCTVISVTEKLNSAGNTYLDLAVEIYRKGKYETLKDVVHCMCYDQGGLKKEIEELIPGDRVDLTANVRFHKVAGDEDAVWLYVRSIKIKEQVRPVTYNPGRLDYFRG